MKTNRILAGWLALVALAIFNLQPPIAFAQGTAFSYQGRLNSGGSPANGLYDLRFTVWDALTNGNLVAGPLTNSATGVSNGLFAVTLDFGSGVFTGPNRWLEVDVRTNGGGAFTGLSPLQPIQPVPYAVMANSASNLLGALSAAQLSGKIPATSITGTVALAQLPAAVLTNNATGVSLSGNLSGAFAGNGAGLTNLNGANLLAGSVGTAQLAGGSLAAPASVGGTTINATANTSYVVTNTGATSVFLPANANLGDVVQITGEGAGGWTAMAQIWTEQTSAPTSGSWNSVASSSDGSHLAAVVDGGGIYTSTNFGVTWTEQTSAPTSTDWWSVASSSDGSHLAAVVQVGGIYTTPTIISSGVAGTSASYQYLGNGQWGAVSLAQSSLPANVVVNNASGVTLTGTFSGNGSGLTSLNASALSGSLPGGVTLPATNLTGTIQTAQLPAVVLTNNETGVTLTGTFNGNGSGLTNIPANAVVTAPPGMALIPAGVFTMGNSTGDSDITDANPANITVSAFYMDINLVSYSQWQSVYYWATSQGYGFVDVGFGKAVNHPVQSVDWYDCVKWSNARSQQAGLTPVYYTDAGFTQVYTNGEVTPYMNMSANGYRLPTEAEWEKAARGGLNGQRFPWGNVITENLANYYAEPGTYSYDLAPYSGFNTNFNTGTQPFTSPAGYFAANGYGLYDMAGNVLQWCWDWYGTPYGQPTTTNPTGPATGSNRVLRGGFWYYYATYARCADRNYNNPILANSNVGFRCVRGH